MTWLSDLFLKTYVSVSLFALHHRHKKARSFGSTGPAAQGYCLTQYPAVQHTVEWLYSPRSLHTICLPAYRHHRNYPGIMYRPVARSKWY